MSEDLIKQVALEAAKEAVARYTVLHPTPPHVNQKQAAQMLNVSESTISNYIKAKKLELNEFGLIPIQQIWEKLKVA